MQKQQPATAQVASRDPKAELTRALRNSSGHHIQARHHLIVIAGQQLKGLEDRAIDALGQVFAAENPWVRLVQPAADASNAASDLRGPSRAVVGLAKIANHRRTSTIHVTATEAKNPFWQPLRASQARACARREGGSSRHGHPLGRAVHGLASQARRSGPCQLRKDVRSRIWRVDRGAERPR